MNEHFSLGWNYCQQGDFLLFLMGLFIDGSAFHPEIKVSLTSTSGKDQNVASVPVEI